MNKKLCLLSFKRIIKGGLLLLLLISLFASLTWAETPKEILDSYYEHDIDNHGPLILKFSVDSIKGNTVSNAQITVYYHDIHNKVVTFSKPENLKSTYYLVSNYNTWLFMANMQNPLRISAQQALFGDIGIAEMVRIDFVTEYKIDKLSEDDTYLQFDVTALDKKTAYQKASLFFRKHGLTDTTNIPRDIFVFYSPSGIELKKIIYSNTRLVNGIRVADFEVKNLLQNKDSSTKGTFVSITPHDMPLSAFNPLRMKNFRLLVKDTENN